MSFLQRLFGKKSAPSGSLEEQYTKFEAEAESARAGYVGTPYNRAGDLALNNGDEQRAARYYGQAIDAFLSDGQREAARGVANKIIRVRPGAVRTLCTLCWLDLAARHTAMALLHLRDYVEAAKKVDRQGLAAGQVLEMARIAPDSEFIGAAADALDQLDQSHLAHEVREWVSEGGSPDAITDAKELADACLQAAIKSNEGAVAREAAAEEISEAEADDAGVESEEPATETDEPEADVDEPAEEPDEPAAEAEEPTADTEEPEDGAAEPEPEAVETEAEATPEAEEEPEPEPDGTDEEPEPEVAEGDEPEVAPDGADPEADEPDDSPEEPDQAADAEPEKTDDAEAEAKGPSSRKKKRKKKKRKKKKKR